MNGKKHTEYSVVHSLGRKRDIMINPHSRHLQLLKRNAPRKENDLGNKSWGKIDFLIKHVGYTVEFVKEFK